MYARTGQTPHGPDAATFDRASGEDLRPQRLADTLAFMFESRYLYAATTFALSAATLDRDYDAAWGGFEKARLAAGPSARKGKKP